MGKDQFTPVYKFTYFKLFHAYVTSLIFFKTTISSQMKHATLRTKTGSFGGFKMEDMIYPCLYSCDDGARACSCSKPPALGGRVIACLCSKPSASFGQGLLF
jgi:hypothetical protein